MVTRSCLGLNCEGICVNLTITHNYCRLRLSGCTRLTLSSRVAWKTNSTLTFSRAVVPGAGIGGESFSRRSCPANLSFTLRLSHSQSQNADSALIWTTALKVTAAVAGKNLCVLMNNEQRRSQLRTCSTAECLHTGRHCARRFNFVGAD